jgi:hypothetical protein
VHPEVVEAMREPDVDLSDRTPHRLDREDIERRVADLAADLPAG